MDEKEIAIIKRYKNERKGMCKRCTYSIKNGDSNRYRCSYYKSWCQLVARNCEGSK